MNNSFTFFTQGRQKIQNKAVSDQQSIKPSTFIQFKFDLNLISKAIIKARKEEEKNNKTRWSLFESTLKRLDFCLCLKFKSR